MTSLRVTLVFLVLFSLHYCTAQWSAWGKCSVSCGDGKRTRKRVCEENELECTAGDAVKETKSCASTPCGPLSCHVGLSSTTGNFDVVNNFKLTECPDAPLTPRTKDGSGRTGLQCSMVTIKVEHGGFMVDMMQGACFTDDMCQSLTCDEYKRMMKLYDVQSCEIQCCTKDGCNNPKHFKPTTATPTGDPCSTNPCKNGGECIRSPSNGMDYTCACKHGFHGMNCESGTSRICYTGVSTRERLKPSGSPMLPTSCAAADDSCLVATVSAYQNAEKIIVDTAQCVKPEVCQALTCEDLKRTMPKFDIESCKITCCNKDECNQASLDLPVVTTTPYPRATTRKPKPKTTRKPPPKTTKKPKTKKPKTTPKPTKKPKRTNKPKTSSEASTASPTGLHWSEWQAWQQCTHRCGSDGTRQRFRFCVNGGPGMPGCSPVTDMMGKEKCNTDVSCVRWREWNHWQSCSRSCGGGTQERRRSCDGGPPNTPGCMGDEMETQNCNQQSCETTTQQTQTTTTPSTTQQSRTRWGEWGRWGVCSTSCDKGIQLRSRECIGGKAGRRGCRGSKVEKQDCNERRCEVVTEAKTTTQAPQSGPVWGEWSDWEQCSATCGPGTTSRSRTCIGAKRRRRCKGQKSDTRSCAVKACEDTGPDKPDAACLQRNVRLARRKGRKCPIGCSSDGECGQGKQCVCDGLCGKTCQEKDKKCRNILSSTPEGTVLSCSNGIFVGSKCTYSCKDGYELQGNADIFCQGTSKWTNEKSMPKCIGTTDRSSTGTTSAEQSCKFKVRAHDSCCGKVSYFSKKARCCSGKAKPAGPAMTECCFQTPYDPLKKGCCGKRLFPLSNKKCKDGKIVNK